VLALAAAVPPEALDDAVLAVAVAELHAGAADLAEDEEAAASQRTAALDLLERGIDQGFAMGAYLRGASEWNGLRADPRFGELLARITTPQP
jgi:hypothetical protein